MTCRTFVLLILVVACSAKLWAADNIGPKLPDDGWWIRYTVTYRQDLNGQVREQTAKETFSLVGTTVDDNVKCRWIEMYSETKSDDTEEIVLRKVLVPEADLMEAEEPFANAKRLWIKTKKVGPIELKPTDRDFKSNNGGFNMFPGLWRESEQVQEERTIDYQHGRLKIVEAKKRKSMFTIPDARRKTTRKFVVETTGWFDPVTAPIVTAVNIHRKVYVNEEFSGTIVGDFVTADFGTDAQSQLPDSN